MLCEFVLCNVYNKYNVLKKYVYADIAIYNSTLQRNNLCGFVLCNVYIISDVLNKP